ncbi:MAG: histidine kinase [Bacteroidota bacterium]
MHRYRNTICALLLLCSFVPAYAQEYPVSHFSVENGLPSSNIYDVFRDHKGFLWFATDKGVARYNGIRFESFSAFDGLSDNEIFYFKEDPFGRLWLGSFNGQLCYYKDGIFHTGNNTPFLKLPFKDAYIKNIEVDKDSVISLYFFAETKIVTIKRNKLTIYPLKRNFSVDYHSNLIHIHCLSANRFELLFPERTVVIDTNSNVIEEKIHSADQRINFTFSQSGEYLFNDHRVYDRSFKEIFHSDRDLYSQYFVYRMYSDGKNFFACTNNGLLINNDKQILQGNKISSMTQDIDGNYWISTLNNGVYSLSKDFLNNMRQEHVYDGVVKYAKIDSGFLFYATDNNNFYRFKDGKAECLFDFKKNLVNNTRVQYDQCYHIEDDHRYYNIGNSSSIIIDNILSAKPKVKLYNDSTLAYVSKKVFITPEYTYVKSFDDILYWDNAQMAKDNAIHVQRFGTSTGIDSREPRYLNRIFAMAKAPDNTIWFSKIDKVYKIVNSKVLEQPQFKNVTFNWFHFYGDYLIGFTHSNKLVICEYANTDSIVITPIPDQKNVWNQLCRLDSNHIIISTNNAYKVLTLYSAGSKQKIAIHTVENPYLPSQAEYITSDGKDCYFLKNGAVVAVKISSLLHKPDPPRLYFTCMKSMDKSYTIHSGMELAYKQAENININFLTLSMNSKDLVYEYSITDDDLDHEADNWHNIKGEEINLFDPGYGNFIVKVRARSASSDYSKPIAFSFTIAKPFWATFWFLSIVFAAFCIVFWFVMNFLIQREKKKKEKENEANIKYLKSEYKALNALMNPHFIFNTLNNVQGLVNANDKVAANTYLRVFADLVRQNMHNISKEFIPLQKEVDLIYNYLKLEKLRFPDTLNYEIKIDESVELSEIMIPPLLIQPLVENAIKHGLMPKQSPDNYVQIRIYEEDNLLHIEVVDNGIGITQSQRRSDSLHQSFGLENVEKRIAQLRIIHSKEIAFSINDMLDEQGASKGTIASISFRIEE